MGFLSWLKKPTTEQSVTKLASTVVSAYNPALGSLVAIVGAAVYQVEIDMAGTASSDTKQATALGMIAVAAQGDKEAKAAAAGVSIPATIAAVVSLFHALGIFIHKKPIVYAPAPLDASTPAK